MFVEYKSQSGHELEDDIKKEMSGDLQKIFLAISNKLELLIYFINLFLIICLLL